MPARRAGAAARLPRGAAAISSRARSSRRIGGGIFPWPDPDGPTALVVARSARGPAARRLPRVAEPAPSAPAAALSGHARSRLRRGDRRLRRSCRRDLDHARDAARLRAAARARLGAQRRGVATGDLGRRGLRGRDRRILRRRVEVPSCARTPRRWRSPSSWSGSRRAASSCSTSQLATDHLRIARRRSRSRGTSIFGASHGASRSDAAF